MLLTLTECLIESSVNKRYTLYGVTLLPFCLDHYLLLKATNNPLITGEPLTVVDVQVAIKALNSRSNEEFMDSMHRPSWKWRLWQWATSDLSLKHSSMILTAYLKDHLPSIPVFTKGEQQKPIKNDVMFLACCELVAKGMDYDRVRRMPLGLVRSIQLGLLETEGHTLDTVMSDLEVEVLNG